MAWIGKLTFKGKIDISHICKRQSCLAKSLAARECSGVEGSKQHIGTASVLLQS